MPLSVLCRPAFDYARAEHRVELGPRARASSPRSSSLALTTSVPLRAEGPAAVADFVLQQGERATLRPLRPRGRRGRVPAAVSAEETERAFRETVDYWHRWLAQCNYRGPLARDGAAARPSP